MRFSLKALFLFFFCFSPVFSFQHVSAQTVKKTGCTLDTKECQTKNAQTFIEDIAANGILPLTDPTLSREKRIEIFRKLFRVKFASKHISKWVIGRYWNKASSQQKKTYIKLFEDLLILTYVERFKEYSSDNFNVEKAGASKSGKTYIVYSRLQQNNGNDDIKILWKLGKRNESFLISDIIVQGTSMRKTIRSEFIAIIQKNGGDISKLLDALEQKVGRLKNTA